MKKRLIIAIGTCSVLLIGIVGLGISYIIKDTAPSETESEQAVQKVEVFNEKIEKPKKEETNQQQEAEKKKVQTLLPEQIDEEVQEEKKKDEFTYQVLNKYYKFSMPESWKNSTVIEQHGNSISVSQKSSYDVNQGGLLFAIDVSKNKQDIESLPDYKILKEKDGVYFYLMLPTDVQSIESTHEEYSRMQKLVNSISDTFLVIGTEGITTGSNDETKELEAKIEKNSDEIEINDESDKNKEKKKDYVIPNSDSIYISKEDLEDLGKKELRIARNEIYARKGYIFNSKELKEHFEKKQWYKGTIESEAFNDGLLNEFEKANIRTIDEYEKDQ